MLLISLVVAGDAAPRRAPLSLLWIYGISKNLILQIACQYFSAIVTWKSEVRAEGKEHADIASRRISAAAISVPTTSPTAAVCHNPPQFRLRGVYPKWFCRCVDGDLLQSRVSKYLPYYRTREEPLYDGDFPVTV